MLPPAGWCQGCCATGWSWKDLQGRGANRWQSVFWKRTSQAPSGSSRCSSEALAKTPSLHIPQTYAGWEWTGFDPILWIVGVLSALLLPPPLHAEHPRGRNKLNFNFSFQNERRHLWHILLFMSAASLQTENCCVCQRRASPVDELFFFFFSYRHDSHHGAEKK